MKPTTTLPDDPALPALAAIRALGLAAAIPALGLDDRPVELTLRGYTPGSRATFEVWAGDRHFALKLYAEDPEPEAELYEALAAVGLVGAGPVRVPPLLARDRTLQVLAIGWLEGPTAAVRRRPRARGRAVRGPGRSRPSGRRAGPGAAATRSRPHATSSGHRVARGPDGAGAPQKPAGGARGRAGWGLAAVRRGAAGQGRAAPGCGSHGLQRG